MFKILVLFRDKSLTANDPGISKIPDFISEYVGSREFEIFKSFFLLPRFWGRCGSQPFQNSAMDPTGTVTARCRTTGKELPAKRIICLSHTTVVGKENHPVGEKLSLPEQRLRQQITRKDNFFLLILIACNSENQAPQKVKPIEGNKTHRY